MLSCVVCANKTHLTFVTLGEGVAALFSHSLYLTDFADCFLELLHPERVRPLRYRASNMGNKSCKTFSDEGGRSCNKVEGGGTVVGNRRR
jgi:hypothetical protein